MNDETLNRKIREIDEAFDRDVQAANLAHNAAIEGAKKLHRNRSRNVLDDYRAASPITPTSSEES